MNGWPLSSPDNLQPTNSSNPPPGAIDLALIDSFTFFFFLPPLSFPLYISVPLLDLSALAKKIKLEAMAGYHSSQQHGGANGENGDHNPGLGELYFNTHAHTMCNYRCMTRFSIVVDTHPQCHHQ